LVLAGQESFLSRPPGEGRFLNFPSGYLSLLSPWLQLRRARPTTPEKDLHPAPIPLFRELLKAEVPGWQSKTSLAPNSPEKVDFKLGPGKGGDQITNVNWPRRFPLQFMSLQANPTNLGSPPQGSNSLVSTPWDKRNFIKSTMTGKKENIKFLIHENCAKKGMPWKHLLYKCYKVKTHTLSTGFSTLKSKGPFSL
jgi:hypothetical protein